MQRFSNILFFAESDTDNRAAFAQALIIAESNQARITMLGVVDVLNIGKAHKFSLDYLVNKLVEQKREDLQVLLKSASIGSIEVEIKVLTGRAFIEIIHETLKHKHDLLIKVAQNSPEFEHKQFGSLDRKLLRKCPCPVWLIKSTQQQGYREILVGLDYEPENPESEALNQQLLEMACALAMADGSDLHVAHIWDVPYESFLRSPRADLTGSEVDKLIQDVQSERRKWLENSVNKHCNAQGIQAPGYRKPVIALIKGDARKELPIYAKEKGVELIVMGTVSRTGIPGFIIGNTAEAIIDQIDSSILAVKPDGFVSPVTLDC